MLGWGRSKEDAFLSDPHLLAQWPTLAASLGWFQCSRTWNRLKGKSKGKKKLSWNLIWFFSLDPFFFFLGHHQRLLVLNWSIIIKFRLLKGFAYDFVCITYVFNWLDAHKCRDAGFHSLQLSAEKIGCIQKMLQIHIGLFSNVFFKFIYLTLRIHFGDFELRHKTGSHFMLLWITICKHRIVLSGFKFIN